MNIKIFFYTLINVVIVCYLWMGLEYLIEGAIVNSPLDNIMMSLMTIYIWFTVKYFVEKKETKKQE